MGAGDSRETGAGGVEPRNAKAGAVCGILALVALISIFVVPGVGTISSPPAGQTAQDTLANFDNTKAALNVALHSLYAVFFIVFFIVLWSMLKGKDATPCARNAGTISHSSGWTGPQW